MAKISVAIPTHDMKNKEAFLRKSLDMLQEQTFTDFEVIISDNSEDDALSDVIQDYDLDISYIKNPIKGMAQNTNEAMKNCTGEIIKILYLDDYLYNSDSLKSIVDNFEGHWLVTGCIHENDGFIANPHFPTYNPVIYAGQNTIGSPSVLAVRNDTKLLFDEELTWLLDVDLYKRYYDKYGEPKILNEIGVVIQQGKHQMTHIISNERKEQEYEYTTKKFN